MIQLPLELRRKIFYMYIPLYMAKMNNVHHELLNKGAMYAKLYKKSQSEINNLKN